MLSESETRMVEIRLLQVERNRTAVEEGRLTVRGLSPAADGGDCSLVSIGTTGQVDDGDGGWKQN